MVCAIARRTRKGNHEVWGGGLLSIGCISYADDIIAAFGDDGMALWIYPTEKVVRFVVGPIDGFVPRAWRARIYIGGSRGDTICSAILIVASFNRCTAVQVEALGESVASCNRLPVVGTDVDFWCHRIWINLVPILDGCFHVDLGLVDSNVEDVVIALGNGTMIFRIHSIKQFFCCYLIDIAISLQFKDVGAICGFCNPAVTGKDESIECSGIIIGSSRRQVHLDICGCFWCIGTLCFYIVSTWII